MTKGWDKPANSFVWHYFRQGNTASACSQYSSFGTRPNYPPMGANLCRKCVEAEHNDTTAQREAKRARRKEKKERRKHDSYYKR
jgi:hypothetical protein